MKALIKYMGLVSLILGLWVVTAGATITVPNVFVPFTTISSSAVNTNFSTIAEAALNRHGDNIDGNITVSNGITIDGADISAYLAGGKVTATSVAANAVLSAGGITAGSGVVGIVGTDGRIPALTSTYLASVDGSTLINITPSNLTGSGRIPMAASYYPAYVSKSGTYLVVPTTDDDIDCDATGGGFTITLPTASGNTGKTVNIKKIDSSANVCTVGTAGGNIDGASTFPIGVQYQNMTFRSTGLVWEIR